MIPKFFKKISKIINNIITTIILTIAYLTIIGITSITAKIFGKNFIKNNKEDTYWKPLDLENEKKERYYQQF